MKRPRIVCKDFVSLSVQANEYAYCEPRDNSLVNWKDYSLVEVGFIEKEGAQFTPPDSWKPFADGPFPSDVYGYIPTSMVVQFIEEHGGQVGTRTLN